jgi:hypothetical protein
MADDDDYGYIDAIVILYAEISFYVKFYVYTQWLKERCECSGAFTSVVSIALQPC